MIQRIQSLYLVLVFILNCCLFFFPIANFKSYRFYIYKIEGLGENIMSANTKISCIPLIILTLVIALLAFGIIFLFKNRGLQIKLVRLNILLVTFFVAGIFFFYIERLEIAFGAKASFTLFSSIPVITLLLLILSMGAIYKDERLVKSTDRLR
jgi:hypothetical protein